MSRVPRGFGMLLVVGLVGLIVFTVRGCQGTTSTDRDEYDELRDAIDAIAWPVYAGELKGGGFPASDVNSLSYGVFVELDGEFTAMQLVNDIIRDLDATQWSVVGTNCDIPSVQIIHVETRAVVLVGPSLNLFQVTYTGTSPTDLAAIEVPQPVCP